MAPVTIGAAVDIGSNSIHLLVAAIDLDGLRILIDESVQLGLGDVVDREGHLPADARDAIVGALEAYAARAVALGAETLSLLATEPLRRASNRSVIQADVLRATGRPLQILSSDAEAQLTLLGVTGGRPQEAPLLVVDGRRIRKLSEAPLASSRRIQAGYPSWTRVSSPHGSLSKSWRPWVRAEG